MTRRYSNETYETTRSYRLDRDAQRAHEKEAHAENQYMRRRRCEVGLIKLQDAAAAELEVLRKIGAEVEHRKGTDAVELEDYRMMSVVHRKAEAQKGEAEVAVIMAGRHNRLNDAKEVEEKEEVIVEVQKVVSKPDKRRAPPRGKNKRPHGELS